MPTTDHFFQSRINILARELNPSNRSKPGRGKLNIAAECGRRRVVDESEGAMPYTSEYGAVRMKVRTGEAPVHLGSIIETIKSSAAPARRVTPTTLPSVNNRSYGLAGMIVKIEVMALYILRSVKRILLPIRVSNAPQKTENDTAHQQPARAYASGSPTMYAQHTWLAIMFVLCGISLFCALVARKFFEKVKQIPRDFYPGQLLCYPCSGAPSKSASEMMKHWVRFHFLAMKRGQNSQDSETLP